MAIDEPLSNPVLQVKQERKDSNRDSKNFIGEFGAKAENIQITLEDNSTNPATIIEQCSLLDFFKNWEDFKTNNAFMYHGKATNLENQVKFWYGDNGYKITQQPQDVEIQTIGDPLVFSVNTNDEAATYQWQRKRTKTEGWTNSTGTGNKTKTLSFNSTSDQMTWIGWRCVINFSNGTKEISNEVHAIWPN